MEEVFAAAAYAEQMGRFLREAAAPMQPGPVRTVALRALAGEETVLAVAETLQAYGNPCGTVIPIS